MPAPRPRNHLPAARGSAPPPRRVVVLGSTGSIGVNALAVVEHLTRTGQRPFEVVGLAAGSDARTLAAQATQFNCPNVALADADAARNLSAARVFAGPDAARQLVEHTRPDVVVAAIVGVAGLPATVQAVEQGCTVALANKETLVAAGGLVMPLAERTGVTLLPVDSEHSAVFQCLAGADADKAVRRVVLTASGGPFRDTPPEVFNDATPEQALKHPTWDMGPKITVDSATMMNKALEVIEAHHLFGLPPELIEVVVHPQSIVHGFVEFADHSVVAQLGPPDMRTPIQVALTWPDRVPGCSDRLDWSKLSRLDFQPPDGERFPALKLAYRVVRSQDNPETASTGAIFNAANEVAVEAFLERRIRFGRIVELVAEALDAVPATPIHTLDDVTAADAAARDAVRQRLRDASAPATA
ncbi:MAG: 1-deoxy-D-xylulose-5-phosphate reductoisomerase [Planctomycetota bacterium]